MHTSARVVQSGYSLQSLYQDAYSLVKKFIQCQKEGAITRNHELPLHPIRDLELFEVWEINFMGLFMCYFGNMYVLVVVDYISEWVEYVSFPNNEGKSVVRFLKRYIFTWFSTQRAIIIGEGSHI